jgi:hypothetical protein
MLDRVALAEQVRVLRDSPNEDAANRAAFVLGAHLGAYMGVVDALRFYLENSYDPLPTWALFLAAHLENLDAATFEDYG